MKAGKHVYIDKPLSVTAESAHRIAEAAEQANMRTQIAFNNRFFPSTLRAKAIVEQGKLGEIVSFQARYLHSSALDPEKSVGWKYEEGGGVILDLASHAADLITWMIGFPEKVSCVVNRLYDERPRKEGSSTGKPLAEDHAILTCRMKNGALGTIEASKIATGSQDELSFEIYGRLGALRWRLTEPDALWFFDATVPEAPFGGMRGWMRIDCTGRYAEPHGAFPPQGASIGWTRSHIHSYYAFLRCVADCEPASPSISEGVPLMELLDAAQISAQNGVWMAL